MKYLLSLSLIVIGLVSVSQEMYGLDSAALNTIEIDFDFVNISAEKKYILESKGDVLIDYNRFDVNHDIDSMVVKFKTNRLTLTEYQPVLIRNLDQGGNVFIQHFKQGDTLTFKQSGTKTLTVEIKRRDAPVFSDDRIVFGILAIVLGFIFYTSSRSSKGWQRFYRIVPALLLCYLIPAILEFLGIVSKEHSKLYPMARDYLLPAALILMTIGIDFKGIMKLGSKALIMFGTATVGIIIGGPIAIMIYSLIDPSVVGGEEMDAAWRGFSTLAGSWIGGGANQAAMLETYGYNPDLYGKMVTVDIVVANLWMAFLLWAAARAEKFDRWLRADSSSIDELKKQVSDYQSSIARKPSLSDYMVILGVSFLLVGVGHLAGKWLAGTFESWLGEDNPLGSSFFWLVVIATTGGLLLSMTRMRSYEGAGALRMGSVFIYILVATIGMKMELAEAIKEPQLILVGIIWMLIHVGLLFLVAKWIKAPFFFVAVGSKANVGGAASAPIVASAFHPSLASVGALLAVLGYAVGTYGAIACAELMRGVAP